VTRKIGTNSVVLRTVEHIRNHLDKTYFVAVIPDNRENAASFFASVFEQDDVLGFPGLGYVCWGTSRLSAASIRTCSGTRSRHSTIIATRSMPLRRTYNSFSRLLRSWVGTGAHLDAAPDPRCSPYFVRAVPRFIGTNLPSFCSYLRDAIYARKHIILQGPHRAYLAV
jgi:hypothetical protein